MSEFANNEYGIPRPGRRLLQALMPFAAQGSPLKGEDERYGLAFDAFTYEANGGDVDLPRDRSIGQINTASRKLGALTLDIEVALLNESAGMMPDYEGTGRLIGAISCSLHEDAEDYDGENELGWEYFMYSSGAVAMMNGSSLNDENFPRFPEMRDEYHAALRALGFDEIVDRMEEGHDASLEGDVNYADGHQIEKLLSILANDSEPDSSA